mgnify:CR=1 FL=1
MSDVVNEAAFLGSENTMAQIVVPRSQDEKREEKANEKETVRAALLPAAAILQKVLDDELAKNNSAEAYQKIANDVSIPDEEVRTEFRVRARYSDKLKHLKKLIDQATKGVSND